MQPPYVGEIIMFGGNFTPVNYASCDGALLPISQFQALFALLGTTYGGDGQTTFALPDMRSRIPMHQGNNGQGTHVIGEKSGTETVTISPNQMPAHTHVLNATSANGNSKIAAGATIPAAVSGTNTNVYSAQATDSNMAASIIGNGGGSQPHNNLPPTMTINFCISLFGVFPSRN